MTALAPALMAPARKPPHRFVRRLAALWSKIAKNHIATESLLLRQWSNSDMMLAPFSGRRTVLRPKPATWWQVRLLSDGYSLMQAKVCPVSRWRVQRKNLGTRARLTRYSELLSAYLPAKIPCTWRRKLRELSRGFTGWKRRGPV